MRYEDTEFDPATDADREAAAREALRLAKERMNSKNVYYLNTSFDTPSK